MSQSWILLFAVIAAVLAARSLWRRMNEITRAMNGRLDE